MGPLEFAMRTVFSFLEEENAQQNSISER